MKVCGKERKTPVLTVMLVSGGWRESKNDLPPVFQQSFSPTLKQFVKLQLELLPLWFLRVGAWTIHIDHSERFLLGPAPVDAHSKKKKEEIECMTHNSTQLDVSCGWNVAVQATRVSQM